MPRIAGILSRFGSKTSIPWSLFYAPGLRHIKPHLRCYLDANCLLVDGTVWTDDELARHGISIGHLPLSGEGDMLSVVGREAIQGWAATRVYYQVTIPRPCMAG